MMHMAVYHYRYLPISEPFIYRQLQGFNDFFDLKVLTSALENQGIYNGFEPIVVPDVGILSSLGMRLWNKPFSKKQVEFIKKQIQGHDLLFVNFGHVGLRLLEIAKSINIPVVCCFHGVDASAFLLDPKVLSKYNDADFEAVITVSQDMKRRLEQHLPKVKKFHVNYLGIPVEEFPFRLKSRNNKGRVFLQISRLSPKKGIETSLHVFRRYLEECDPEAKFIIAGDGPLKNSLRRLSKTLGVQNQVHFAGPVTYPKTMQLMHSCDVFLQHSVTAPDGDMEGLPIVLIEAMACGIPVVSTYHSGIPELIENGINGYLVPEKGEDEYFNIMSRLTHEDLNKISVRARKTVEERFDSNVTNVQLSKYLMSII